ncbi:diguanylate cyclase [Orrella sp. 11846]|uniref:diguanylate cyclase n=1 Tax=Orrella sp. 11846 TaxID=3409913 RepID=UPI003B5CEFFE
MKHEANPEHDLHLHEQGLKTSAESISEWAIFWRAFSYFGAIVLVMLLVAWPGYSELMAARRDSQIEAQQAYLKLFEQKTNQEIHTTGSIIKLMSRLMLTHFATTQAGRQPEDWLGFQDHLRRVKRTFPFLSSLRLYDERGGLIISLVDTSRTADAFDQRSASLAMAQMKNMPYTDLMSALYVSNVRTYGEQSLSKEFDASFVQMISPVLNEQGNITGFVAGEIGLDSLIVWLDQLLQSTLTGASLEVFDTAGRRLFPVRDALYGEYFDTDQHESLVRQIFAPVQIVNDGVVVTQAVFPMEAFKATLIQPVTLNADDQFTQNQTGLVWHLRIFIPKSAWLSKTILAQPWVQAALVFLLIALAIGCWSLARTQRVRALVGKMQAQYAEELSDLYENAPVCYQSVGADGYYLRMNQTGLDWLGYRREEVVGKLHYSEILQPDHDSYGNIREDHLVALQSQGALIDYPMWMQRKDGSRFPVSLSASLMYDDQGQLLMTRSSITDMSQRRLLEDRLHEMAYTDELTGAINRRQFFALSDMILRQGEREGAHHVLLGLDIDHFKDVNDTYGHAVGDQALIEFVRTCLKNVRPSDLVARLGGEEFSILLANIDLEVGLAVAERIRTQVQALEVPVDDGSVLHFTVSIGLVSLTAETGLVAALKAADKMLYIAKTQGRNQVVYTSERI